MPLTIAGRPLSNFFNLVRLNLRYLIYSVGDWWGDVRYGVDTRTGLRGSQSVAELTLIGDARSAEPYFPAPYGMLHRVFAALPADLSNYAFVDFGSGKGRVVIVATGRGFREVFGVEFAKELHDAAERNVRSAGVTAQMVLGDAGDFVIPSGPCTLFFFNPFKSKVMEKIVQNVLSSHKTEPRHIIIVYYHATMLSAFEKYPAFRRAAVVAEGWFDRLSHSGRYSAVILELRAE